MQELTKLDADLSAPDLWNDQNRAQKLLRQKALLSRQLDEFNQFSQEVLDLTELLALAKLEDDANLQHELHGNLGLLAKQASKLKTECLFQNEHDICDCFLEINAGAGGTESHDWANMLQRMYLRWADRRGFKTQLIDELVGEEAGIKSATIKIQGDYAYGWCQSEKGVHRLVRISPFNAAGKRQTSFASIWVYPVLNDDINIDIQEKDLRIDTYRASGAGGQHVNTTDSAVRITHLPTNIVVQCQNDRSQHRNKAEAMSMLKARLYEAEIKKKEAEANIDNSAKTDIGWGHQIRSYVLQPYQMVKDLRTQHETSDVQNILDGDLDEIMMSYLTANALNNQS